MARSSITPLFAVMLFIATGIVRAQVPLLAPLPPPSPSVDDWSPPAIIGNNLRYDPRTNVGAVADCFAEVPPLIWCFLRTNVSRREVCYTCLLEPSDTYTQLFRNVRMIGDANKEILQGNGTKLFIRLYNVTDFPAASSDFALFDSFDENLANVLFTFANGSEALYRYVPKDHRTTTTPSTTTPYPTTVSKKFLRGGLAATDTPGNVILKADQQYATGAPRTQNGSSSLSATAFSLLALFAVTVVRFAWA